MYKGGEHEYWADESQLLQDWLKETDESYNHSYESSSKSSDGWGKKKRKRK